MSYSTEAKIKAKVLSRTFWHILAWERTPQPLFWEGIVGLFDSIQWNDKERVQLYSTSLNSLCEEMSWDIPGQQSFNIQGHKYVTKSFWRDEYLSQEDWAYLNSVCGMGNSTIGVNRLWKLLFEEMLYEKFCEDYRIKVGNFLAHTKVSYVSWANANSQEETFVKPVVKKRKIKYVKR